MVRRLGDRGAHRRRGRHRSHLHRHGPPGLTGGPCHYIGRGMKTSHRGLGITNSDWDANLRASEAALAKNGVGNAERAEFLALFKRYRDDIVEAG